jgi:hemerythrin-like domain-containing protein
MFPIHETLLRRSQIFRNNIGRSIALNLRSRHLQGIIPQLLQEHRVIAAAGEELLMRLNKAEEGGVIARATVEAAAATYLVYYRHHLATEEREILPRAAQLLTQDDWAVVAAAVPAAPDPLFGDDGEAGYQELRRQILLEARAL